MSQELIRCYSCGEYYCGYNHTITCAVCNQKEKQEAAKKDMKKINTLFNAVNNKEQTLGKLDALIEILEEDFCAVDPVLMAGSLRKVRGFISECMVLDSMFNYVEPKGGL